MASNLKLAELRKELIRIADEEIKKTPNIRKNQLKKKIREQVFPSGTIEEILPKETVKTINTAIGSVTEMAVTMAKLGIELKHVRKGAPRKTVKKARKKKKRGKPMAAVVEEIFKSNKTKTMKITDIKKEILTKKRGYKEKEKKLYTLITIALNQSKKFEKVGPGEYKLIGEKTPKNMINKKVKKSLKT